jgi:CRISPR-associated protein Cmr1
VLFAKTRELAGILDALTADLVVAVGPNQPRFVPSQRFIVSNRDGTSFEPPKNTPPLFPRAVFGLPIVFQFQKEKSDQKSDPPVHTLEPGEVNGKRIERMASSLIIRPYLDKAGRWHAAVLALPNRLDAHAPLVLRQDRQAVGVGHILPRNDSENSFVPVDIPMKGRANNPLDAFLHYFQGKAASHGGGK